MLPDIPGELIRDRNILINLKERVCEMLDSSLSAKRFPGAQPVSFGLVHLEELRKENYFVSEKADGIRLLLYSRTLDNLKVESYLIDRKNNYYKQKFGLPLPGREKSHRNTILDGELVLEKSKDGKSDELLFLIFDALIIDDKNITMKPYTSRLGYMRQYVMGPYLESCQKDPRYYRKFPFHIRAKRLEMSYNLGVVFEHMQKYKHETDGVIFTSSVAPYAFATCDKMLKWKPPHENTVDFKLLNVEGEYHLGILVENDEYQDFGQFTVEPELEEEWEKTNHFGKIIECRYDPDWPNNWRFSRFRNDKLTSNHISVYEKIMKSISDNVTKEKLIENIPAIYDGWKERDPSIKPFRK